MTFPKVFHNRHRIRGKALPVAVLLLQFALTVVVSAPASAQVLYTWQWVGPNNYCIVGTPSNPMAGFGWEIAANWAQSTWAGPGIRIVIDAGPNGPQAGPLFRTTQPVANGSPFTTSPDELFVAAGNELVITGGVAQVNCTGPNGNWQDLLPIGGSLLHNDGLITVSPAFSAGPYLGGIQFTGLQTGGDPTIEGNGTISFIAASALSPSGILWLDGTTLTHGAGHTISGHVRLDLYGVMINSGTLLGGGSFTGPLDLNGAQITQTASGVIHADGPSHEVLLNRSTHVVGGTIGGINGGAVLVEPQSGFPNPRLESVTIDGLVHFLPIAMDTLEVAGNMINNGELRLESGYSDGMRIQVVGNTTFSGNGTLSLLALNDITTRAHLSSSGTGDVLTNDSQHTIRGGGQIHVALDNRGTITADMDNRDLFCLYPTLINSGALQAENGGDLWLEGVTVQQSATGTLRGLGTNSEVELGVGSRIVGGRIGGSGGGIVRLGDGATIETLTIDGELSLGFNGNPIVVTAVGDMDNQSTVHLPPLNTGSVTNLTFDGSATWSGPGVIDLEAFSVPTRAQLVGVSPADILTNASGHTIRGNGNIAIALNNLGTISADRPTGWHLVFSGEPKTNAATVQAASGGTLDVDGTTLNQTANGTLIARDGSLVQLYSAARVVGGTVGTEGTGVFQVVTAAAETLAVLQDVTVIGRVDIAQTKELELQGVIVNDGEIVVSSGPAIYNYFTKLDRFGPVVVNGAGTIILNATPNQLTAEIAYGNLATDIFTNGPGHTIAGRGTLAGHFVNDGILAPGSDYEHINDPTRRFRLVDGGVTCGPTSRLEIQIEGTSSSPVDEQFDHIYGDAGTYFHCDGELFAQNFNGFAGLAPTDTLDIIVAPGGVTGTFTSVSPGFVLIYEAGRVRLTGPGAVSAVGDGSGPALPSAYRCAPEPNPFNPTTTFRFSLPQASPVRMDIFDLAGRRIARLLNGETLAAGYHEVRWRGATDDGRSISSGIYYYRMQAGREILRGKVTLLK